jgi:hypothetical protein
MQTITRARRTRGATASKFQNAKVSNGFLKAEKLNIETFLEKSEKIKENLRMTNEKYHRAFSL